MKLGTLLLIDTGAALAGTGGILAMLRGAPDEAAAYRQRLLGAMVFGLALIAAGFTTASWVATS